ncbi:hypothetical protein AB0L97_32860 [Nocardia sp. NPDC051911]|uniref:hypothetical protein n=1 Tax=Nocardia sp. NPDC051911 TaxID=3154648 RepID=UPI00343D00C8
MIELQLPEKDPVEQALLDWFPKADLYRDGELVHRGVNLLGGSAVAAAAYAKAITAHLAAAGPDIAALGKFLLSKDAARHVRANSSAPLIAESIITMLTERGLL